MSPRPATDVASLRNNLLKHAQAVVMRDGVDGLTMRALAAESGTAVGLSYKAFASREDLLWELTWLSLAELTRQLDDWIARPGGKLQDRLMEFYDLHLTSVAPILVDHSSHGPRRNEFYRMADEVGITRTWAEIMSEFLQIRQEAGDVQKDVNTEAFGFIITAAMRHVLMTDRSPLAPDQPTLARYITGVATQISQ